MQINKCTDCEQGRKYFGSHVFESVAGEAGGDQRIVMRPDRTIVIRNRIVSGFSTGYRANSPTRVEIRLSSEWATS